MDPVRQKPNAETCYTVQKIVHLHNATQYYTTEQFC